MGSTEEYGSGSEPQLPRDYGYTPSSSSSSDPQLPRDFGYTPSSSSSYILSGKIMLSAIVILFTVVILILCLYIFTRWFLHRVQRPQPARHRHRRHRRRRPRIVLSFQLSNTSTNRVIGPSRGLDESTLKSLPTFVYSSSTHGDGVLECAVCLSEFEDDEKGRLLPKCNHSFHLDCIDMWFQSHSTCPLCRTPVGLEIPAPAPALLNETPVELAATVAEPEPGPSSELCPSCLHEKHETGCSSSSSSSSSTLETVTFSIEVPRRNYTLRGGLEEEEEEELCKYSPGGQQGLRFPGGGRIQSLKRIWSRERKGGSSISPCSVAGLSYSSSAADIDLESGST